MIENTPFEAVLKKKAQVLLDNLEDGNMQHAVRELLNINDARDSSLYQQIGKITRGLHNTISKLEITGQSEDGSSYGRDVNARVDYVIQLTHDAANQTMDLADEATPIAAELESESSKLRQEWHRLGERQINATEFRRLYKRIDDFLKYAEEKSNQLHHNLTDIVVAQSYQDLSGQVLRKIIDALESTESELITLLEISGQIQDVSGFRVDDETHSGETAGDSQDRDLEAEGPLPDEVTTLKNQDDVDSLLSSLGF